MFFGIFVGVVQQAQWFLEIANFVVSSRMRFSKKLSLTENNQIRSSYNIVKQQKVDHKQKK